MKILFAGNTPKNWILDPAKQEGDAEHNGKLNRKNKRWMNCVSKVKIFIFWKSFQSEKKGKKKMREKNTLSIGYIVYGDRKVYSWLFFQ